VLVGQLNIQVPAVVKTVFFDCSCSHGYKVGPQFLPGPEEGCALPVTLTVVLCVTCLVAAFAARSSSATTWARPRASGRAFSESTVIGTAGDAINRLAIEAGEKTALINNIPVAYAVTLPGWHGRTRVVLPVIGPKLIGVNLKQEGKKAQTGTAEASATEPWITRRHTASTFAPIGWRTSSWSTRRSPSSRRSPATSGLHSPDPARGRDHRAAASTVIRWDDVIAVARGTECS